MAKKLDKLCSNIVFGVALVDFHHTRGPEVEHWYSDELKDCTWANLPFQALPDGSHSFEETFTYFTLLYDEENNLGLNGIDEVDDINFNSCTTLFAISCSRQIKTDDLLNKGDDVTRSTVQKSLAVISRIPIFGQIKDKLSIVTNALFMQRDFTDTSIIYTLYQNLKSMFCSSMSIDECNLFVGLSLRKVIHEFKRDILVILKAVLLEKKIIFYGSNVEELCGLQFGFISLIPSLISNLGDCGSPSLNKYETGLKTCDSFKSSDRKSVLRFLGFPLQIFGKGGLFSPYTPLQQLSDLTSSKTQWYVIGTSNSLLLEQKHNLADLLVNVDSRTVELVSEDKVLNEALQLSHQDRKWMDLLIQNINNTWNEYDLTTPSTFQFEGSEDFIRWQFEEYLTGLMSSVKLDGFLTRNSGNEMNTRLLPTSYIQEDPTQPFNPTWIQLWRQTQNYKMFYIFTDDRLFDLFEPKHVYNGVDPAVAWQRRFIKSLRILNRESKSTTPEVMPNEVKNSETRLPETNSSLDERKDNENIRHNGSGWYSWKDYFNSRSKKRDDEEFISSPKNISVAVASDIGIGSALAGLGLKSPERTASPSINAMPEILSLPKDMVENPWK
ncbi:Avl9p Ecym_4239 [Eremothecium cymbalariae DBVPG|uniref:UDENN domain-containing protein n=1 Tax=Eremothecium cymbalariae (strain CBS 270.75 / DBVPG 7215 / KCTC 17166 / NRRL Y-17582) TaxID=931890 RepID=G8JTF2_ERECY|nr:hypothetical protein Ecym_4239 [Eremothecium cymbalariae DBVPG\